MNTKPLIPLGREIRFIGISVLVLLMGIGIGLVVVLMVFSQELSPDFTEAHGALLRLNQQADVVFVVAVLLQTAVSLILIYILALRYSHKVSGPMYRVRMVLEAHLRGDASESVRFRSGDFLVPVADALSGLLRQQEADDRTIHAAVRLLSSSSPSEMNACLPEIRKLLDQLRVGNGNNE